MQRTSLSNKKAATFGVDDGLDANPNQTQSASANKMHRRVSRVGMGDGATSFSAN